ncbi:MAG TPA: hypothetical protein VGA85_07370 [Dehalococcoidales bacterium]
MIEPKPVYLPDNEPYLGRASVYNFDKVIMSCLEQNAEVATYTHHTQLSDLQKAACQIIPQGINLALTIRELIRQGYLFGALVLMRPLIERTATISYLHSYPDQVGLWKAGWEHKGRPKIEKRLETMSDKYDKEFIKLFNSLTHGDPVAANWNLVHLSDNGLGYSVGKVINDPELCDFICFQSYCYLIVLMGMMAACFPKSHDIGSGQG